MTLVCKKCGYQFVSVILDPIIAFKQLIEKSTRHTQQAHKEVFEIMAPVIQKAVMALTTVLHFDEMVVVPEDEKWVKEQLTEMQSMLDVALGYDEDEEDELEEDEPGEIEPGVIEIDSTESNIVEIGAQNGKEN